MQMPKTQRKVLALRSSKDGPKVRVKRADRVIVLGLGVGDEIALHSDDVCILAITEPGIYELKIKDQDLYVKRVSGLSPVDVFVERDVCH